MEPVLLYITARNREEAISLSRELLSHRLVACTNITEHVTAMYHWQGEIEQTAEAVVIAKTLKSLIRPAVQKIKQMHSYSNPWVLALPVEGGSDDYIAWLKSEVESASSVPDTA